VFDALASDHDATRGRWAYWCLGASASSPGPGPTTLDWWTLVDLVDTWVGEPVPVVSEGDL
jgi:hypothetical protein